MTEEIRLFGPEQERLVEEGKSLLQSGFEGEGVEFLFTERGSLLIDLVRVLERSRLMPSFINIGDPTRN